jgi:hypothetical protein
MWRRFGGAGEWQRALDHVREADRPFVGLLGPHRPSEDEFQALDAEVLAEQAMLRAHIVATDIRECAPIERRRSVAGR